MGEEAIISVSAALVYALATLVAGTTVYNMYLAMLGLMAKRRASVEVTHVIENDEKLREAIQDLSLDQKLQLISKQIEYIVRKLPEKEKKIVIEGLHQQSKAAAIRFLKDVAAA